MLLRNQFTRVAYILTPIDFAGSEKVSITFLKNVDRNKFNIRPIILIRPWEKENLFAQKLEKEGFQFFRVPVAKRPRSEGRDYLRIIRCYKIIYKILKRGSFDLVHTHGYFADIVGIMSAKALHIPTISTCHGFISNNLKYKIYNLLERIVLRLSDEIIAVSDKIKEELVSSGINGSRIIVIQNAIDNVPDKTLSCQYRRERRHLLNIENEDYVIGYVGRLSAEKGIRYLCEAVSSLSRLKIKIKLIIIGDGPERKELEDLVRKENIEDIVIFAGFQAEIEKWIPAIDIFVLPSLTEGTPMALLEAMSFEIPVIATRVGGVPGIIRDGRNGILVNPADPKGLSEKIQMLIQNTNLHRLIVDDATETIKREFNVNRWCKKIEEQYGLLIKRF